MADLRLIHSGEPITPEMRINGLLGTMLAIKHFSGDEIRRYRQEIKTARDELSILLDKADGKNA
jgi:hypothetical protein